MTLGCSDTTSTSASTLWRPPVTLHQQPPAASCRVTRAATLGANPTERFLRLCLRLSTNKSLIQGLSLKVHEFRDC
jgi:hypothetical protein